MTIPQKGCPSFSQAGECSSQPFDIQIANEQATIPFGTGPFWTGTSGLGAKDSGSANSDWLDPDRLREVVRQILVDSGFLSATISIAVVDDPTIHRMNRQYLDHDWPTDVLSFPLETDEGHVEGEVVVSADTACRQAAQYGWRAVDELLLYVIHGSLHLVGYRDKKPDEIVRMRAAELNYIQHAEVPVPAGDERWHGLSKQGDMRTP